MKQTTHAACSKLPMISNLAWSRFVAAQALIVVALMLTTAGARADESAVQDPAVFLTDFSDEAIAMLADKTLSDSDRETEFGRLFNEGFDVGMIGRFVLGRFWKVADDQQRQEYQDLFESFIIATYARRLGGYDGESLAVGKVQEANEKRAVVSSQVIRPKNEPINVDWRMRRAGSGWKIVDIVVEGISMAVTQRSEFASVISNNGGHLEALLTKLRERTTVMASQVE